MTLLKLYGGVYSTFNTVVHFFKVVSKKIAEGDTVSLTGLVTSDILPSVQRSTSLMSLSQREQIAVNVDDIYFSFPYQVGKTKVRNTG